MSGDDQKIPRLLTPEMCKRLNDLAMPNEVTCELIERVEIEMQQGGRDNQGKAK
jgi:hypothetical protein